MSDSLRSKLLVALVVAYATVAGAYAVVWMAAVAWRPPVDFGATVDEHTLEIVALRPGGPAERDGLTRHDRLLALQSQPVATHVAVSDVLRRAAPGDALRVMVNLAGLNQPRSYDVVLGPPLPRERGSWLAALAGIVVRSFPLLVVAGATAALYRRDDAAEAWMLAGVAAGMAATASLVPFYEGIPPGLRGIVVAFKIVLAGSAPALLHALLAAWGRPTPVAERFPWLRSAWLAAAVAIGAPLAVWSLATDGFGPTRGPWTGVGLALVVAGWIAALALGLPSLWAVRSPVEARRKARIVGAGLATGAASLLLWAGAAALLHRPMGELPVALRLHAVLGILLVPLACGYVLTADTVLDLPVLVRRAARDLLVERGSRWLILALAATISIGVADLATRALSGALRIGVALPIALACLVLLAAAARQLHARVRDDVDRVLFRREHATGRLLDRLEQDLDGARSAGELSRLLGERLGQALAPVRLAIYLRQAEQRTLDVACGVVPDALKQIPLDRPFLPGPAGHALRPIGALDGIAELGRDCLIPIAGSGTGLLGLVVLGPRRSDEPYSREERERLASLASRAGSVLERFGGRTPQRES